MFYCPGCCKSHDVKWIIEGKVHYLYPVSETNKRAKRRFCYNCKPLKKQQEKTDELKMEKERRCSLCGEKTHIENFSSRTYKGKNKVIRFRRYRCRKCENERTKKLMRERKTKSVEYKGGKCEKCGYNKCLGALEFHHLDPTKKDFAIGLDKRKFEKIKEELDKCQLLCANCHKEAHNNLIDQQYQSESEA